MKEKLYKKITCSVCKGTGEVGRGWDGCYKCSGSGEVYVEIKQGKRGEKR